ncbi:MAG: SRPBCC family protein [Gemmatimonadetes bacterium]|nr:SRPBCC family protein [Gemmatimonadota bacterium]
MTSYSVESTARIHAPAAIAYGIIADYQNGHPHILPSKFFRNLTVEAGGIGAGTRIAFEMGALGTWRRVTAEISEPEPGRVIHEHVITDAIETHFVVDPVASGACDVTIRTALRSRGGIAGGIERLATTALLRRVYRAELTLLDTVARQRASR